MLRNEVQKNGREEVEMRKVIFVLSVLFFLVCTQAHASLILVSNLDQTPGGLWNLGSTIGQAFESGQAITINSATFMLGYGGYSPSTSAYLTIQDAANDGKIGANILSTWSLASGSTAFATYSGTYTLATNTVYWLVIHDTNTSVVRTSSTATYTANFGVSLPSVYNNYESSTDSYYNLAVDKPLMFQVNAVPIPGAMWLFGPGLASLVAFRRRYKG
jgi:hypothetical protein